MNLSILFFLLLLSPDLNKCEIFTNPIRLFELFKAEEKIAKLIQDSPLKNYSCCLKR
jgi:hypothetical protein